MINMDQYLSCTNHYLISGHHRLIKSSFGSKLRNIYYTKNNKADCEFLKKDYNLESPNKGCIASSNLLNQKTYKCYRHSNRDDPPEKRPSRLCILRQKVLPCLSTIFRQSASNKLAVKLRERKQANTSCQQCQTCLRKKIKKPNTRRGYSIVQPVYAFEAGVHLPKVFIPNDGPKNTDSSTSTSDSGNPEKLRRKNSKYKKRFRMEMMREHWNYQRTLKQKHQKHHNTPTEYNPVHQVFSSFTRCHQSCLASSISDYSYIAEMPSVGFWDFLFDKIQTKYQTHRCEVKPCTCDESSLNNSKPGQCCCDPKIPCSSKCTHACQFPSLQNLPTQGSPMSPASPKYHAAGNSGSSVEKPIVQCKCKPPSTKNPKSQGTAPISPIGSPPTSFPKSQQDSPPANDYPQCPPKRASVCSLKQNNSSSKCCSPACKGIPARDNNTSCQKDHDQIKNMLKNKYNGEILCIHNPPCILINGCLNLPGTTVEPPSNSFWPILFKNIPKKKHTRNVKKEKNCQYGQSCNMQNGRVPELNEEEKMQSLCSHVPPCDLIRSCEKKKYEQNLDSCDVPLCMNRDDAVVNRSPWGSLKNYACDHFPMCQELPIDGKTYDLLNGSESFGVQAQQDTSRACRHTPPCIMVPKCMGGVTVLNNYMQYDAIPDCNHSPVCENVPACCRKNNKEMVSVSTQYPHSCRIV